jgi:serine/threonine protein kinase
VKLSSTGVEFDAPCWNHISGYAVDMIKKMTERLPENRISAQTLITHEWFEIMGANKKNAPIAVDQKIIENLKGFKSVSRLHRACLNLIVKSIDGEQLDYLRS